MIEDYERLLSEAYAKGGRELEQATRAKLQEEKKILENHKKKEEAAYYKKVNERVKRELQRHKQEVLSEYKELARKRAEIEIILNNNEDKNRNMLKLIKIDKDMKKMMEDNSETLKGEPKIDYKYADYDIGQYIDAIKPPKDYIKIQQEMIDQLEKLRAIKEIPNAEKKSDWDLKGFTKLDIEEGTVPDLEDEIDQNNPNKKEFKWNNETENELIELVVKHTLDFAKVQRELYKKYSGCKFTIDDLCHKWSILTYAENNKVDIEKHKVNNDETDPKEKDNLEAQVEAKSDIKEEINIKVEQEVKTEVKEESNSNVQEENEKYESMARLSYVLFDLCSRKQREKEGLKELKGDV